MSGSHPTRLPRTIWVRARGWDVLSRFALYTMRCRASLLPPPCGRRTHVPRSSGTAFRERRLKPTRQPLQNFANKSMSGSHPTRLPRTIWVRARGWDVLSRFALYTMRCRASLLPPPCGRRTHVPRLSGIPLQAGRLKPTRQPLLLITVRSY